MKTIKHNIVAILLLSVSILFAQTKTQKSSESFNVKKDVIVEINAHDSDIIVEHWDKNEVSVEIVLSIDGVTTEESKDYFDSWNIEALGNSTKVVVNSRSDFYYSYGGNFNFVMPDIPEMDFDFEPIIAYAIDFDSVSFPTPPAIPQVVIAHMPNFEWDQEEFEKDKDKYLAKFEKQQAKWAKEFEGKFEPMMKDYEKEMSKWEKEFEEKYEPMMEEYEKEMEQWQVEFEKNIEPQMKKYEEEMAVHEKKIEIHMAKMEKEMDVKHEKQQKLKKKITIKIPKDARVKVNTHNGSIKLPKGVKRV